MVSAVSHFELCSITSPSSGLRFVLWCVSARGEVATRAQGCHSIGGGAREGWKPVHVPPKSPSLGF